MINFRTENPKATHPMLMSLTVMIGAMLAHFALFGLVLSLSRTIHCNVVIDFYGLKPSLRLASVVVGLVGLTLVTAGLLLRT